jgi:hypothetical protein
MSSHWKAVFGIIAIFLLGFLSGVVGSSIFAHHEINDFLKHPGATLMHAMEVRLTKNLDLDANQKEQIHGYFMDNMRQHKLLQAQIQPQVAQLNSTTVRQIRGVLRPDQQTVFDQNLDDLKNRFWKYASSQEAGQTSPEVGATNAAPVSTP